MLSSPFYIIPWFKWENWSLWGRTAPEIAKELSNPHWCLHHITVQPIKNRKDLYIYIFICFSLKLFFIHSGHWCFLRFKKCNIAEKYFESMLVWICFSLSCFKTQYWVLLMPWVNHWWIFKNTLANSLLPELIPAHCIKIVTVARKIFLICRNTPTSCHSVPYGGVISELSMRCLL